MPQFSPTCGGEETPRRWVRGLGPSRREARVGSDRVGDRDDLGDDDGGAGRLPL